MFKTLKFASLNITHLTPISLKNKKAHQLIDKILADLNRSGIITNTLTEDLLALRSYALEEQIPLVVKVLRLSCEHITENETFSIAIPDDEPISDDTTEHAIESIISTPVESLSYMVALIKDLDNKTNVTDLKEYRDALIAF